jgi:2-keto-4-pentenoate hydratase/2-oxohepta-3-ene-1,7-dioic acid hydratase in catechol pathway
MKLCRFLSPEDISKKVSRAGATAPDPARPMGRAGVVEGARVHEIASIFEVGSRSGRSWQAAEVRLLAPVQPSKIVCLGRSYAEHAAELGNEVPKEPLIFLKPPSSVIGPEESIVMPAISKRVDYEGECAVVIGKRLHLASKEAGETGAAAVKIADYVLGYTCLNDVTARDIQKSDVQFTRGKGFDTFCPIGPVIETEFDAGGFSVTTNVNGQRKQHGFASQMLFSVDVIIRWIAQVMTLFPGDVIATGTPPGVGTLTAGDVVEVTVSGIGTLRNPVKPS